MNKSLSAAELAELSVAFPPMMTRNEKLERWATLLERSRLLKLADGIEYRWEPIPGYIDVDGRPCTCLSCRRAKLGAEQWAWPDSPMQVAFRDPILRDAGLAGETIGDAIKFFGLSREEIHEFSCGCGGDIEGAEAARRVRGMKGPERIIGKMIDSASWTGL